VSLNQDFKMQLPDNKRSRTDFSRPVRPLSATAILIALLVTSGRAASAPQPQSSAPLRVGVCVEPPFVSKVADGYGGLAIEVWEQIAFSQGWKSKYIEASSFPELLDMVNKGTIDIAVGDLTITSQRLKLFDFSQPYFDSGLQIMIDSRRHTELRALLTGMYEAGHLRIIAAGTALLVLATLALTIFDRRLDPEFHKKWVPGLADSFYHVMSTSVTGNPTHKRIIEGPLGVFLAALCLMLGVLIAAYITSSMTSVMTANTLHGEINGPQDLPGKKVGTIAGTTPEAYCRSAGLEAEGFSDVDSAVRALLAGQISAIVYNAPTLRFYEREHPDLPVIQVGPLFAPRKFGFAMPLGSPLERAVNPALVGLIEDSFIDRLSLKYLGTSTQ
jgi:polar amino acid transport system substrate-binding protein